MGLSNFVSACRAILRNPGVNPARALLRHALWHPARRFLPLPATLELTPRSQLFLTRREEMNGCVAHVWSERLYDYHNMSFLRDLGARGLVGTCFDIGANIGIYSLLMSEAPAVSVHAFEPHPATFNTLARILEHNHRANVRAWKIALSDHSGALHFTNEAFSPLNKALVTQDLPANTIQVPCETGEAFCALHDLAPDLLKIDTEGLEPAVLRGFGRRLHTVSYVLAEMNASPDIMREVLPPEVFEGPLHVNFSQRRLLRQRFNHEDAVYLNRQAVPALTASGFTIEACP